MPQPGHGDLEPRRGRYRAMHANNNHTYELARITASTADLTKMNCYLSIGEGVHVRPPADIHVTPGRIVSTSSSIHAHTIDCDTTDAGAVVDTLHAGIRWHLWRGVKWAAIARPVAPRTLWQSRSGTLGPPRPERA